MAERGTPPNTQVHFPLSSPSKTFKPPPVFDESERPGKRPRLESPVHMTAAAAHAEARQRNSPAPSSLQTSPNPQAQALGALMGVSHAATSPALQHAKVNPATTMSQPLSIVAENLQSRTEGHAQHDPNAQLSPATSIGTIGSIIGASGSGTAVASPNTMDGVAKVANEPASPIDPQKGASYPAPFLTTPQAMDAARRGMSLPGSASRPGARSPTSSNKKHKCPYCSTEFTRHHNLKSHLLTHSQEKPYVCSTCNSRFRRLHDLKRHTKLHTGERPHVCPKCNRKFARGDALARHNKGPGGCAGRRASMGSFGGDDDDGEGDESMAGVVYGEPEDMDNEEAAMRGTPQIRRQPPSGDDSIDSTANYRLSSTYPPIQGRPVGSSFPPPGYQSSNAPVPPNQYQPPPPRTSKLGPGGPVFAQNPISESPTPISPAQRQNTRLDSLNTNRSPSISQYGQSYPPRGVSASNSLAVPPHVPQLPPPHGLNPPDPRFTLPSQAGPTHPPTQPSGPPTHMSGSGPLSSHSNSTASHNLSGHGSGEGHHKGTFPTNEERLWAVVRTMEQQMGIMRETIEALRNEVGGLRQIIEQQHRV